MITGKAEVKCPFCGKPGVKAFVKPSYLQGTKSSISNKSTMKFHRVPESCEYQGSCPNCGKSAREMQEAQRTGITKKESYEERLKRIRDAGLPTEIRG